MLLFSWIKNGSRKICARRVRKVPGFLPCGENTQKVYEIPMISITYLFVIHLTSTVTHTRSSRHDDDPV